LSAKKREGGGKCGKSVRKRKGVSFRVPPKNVDSGKKEKGRQESL